MRLLHLGRRQHPADPRAQAPPKEQSPPWVAYRVAFGGDRDATGAEGIANRDVRCDVSKASRFLRGAVSGLGRGRIVQNQRVPGESRGVGECGYQ